MFEMLPVEIIDKIVLLINDPGIARIMKSRITKYAFDKIEKNILVFGQVQSGKTSEIVKIIKSKVYSTETKVLVVQNSLLVLNQYINRFKSQGIKFQVVSKDTTATNITEKCIIVMNNKYRYNHFKNVEPDRYILILDEADQTISNCPLKNMYKTFYVTATPYKMKIQFDKVICAQVSPGYHGIQDLEIVPTDDLETNITEFLRTRDGVMLINKYSTVFDMNKNAKLMSEKYTGVPFMVLSSEKYMYINSKKIRCNAKSVSGMIDSLHAYPHIVIVANRLSNRGLSFVSSDYTRYITHQICKVSKDMVNFIQKLRILGVRNARCQLKLAMRKEDVDRFRGYIDKASDYECK